MTSYFVRIHTAITSSSAEPGIHALGQGGEARASSARNKVPSTLGGERLSRRSLLLVGIGSRNGRWQCIIRHECKEVLEKGL